MVDSLAVGDTTVKNPVDPAVDLLSGCTRCGAPSPEVTLHCKSSTNDPVLVWALPLRSKVSSMFTN